MIWTEPYRISSQDVDFNGVVTVTAIMRYMQEAAALQVRAMGPSNEYLRDNGMAFVLSRFAFDAKAPLFAYDNVNVQTWGVENKRLLFRRCYALLREGEILCRGQATMGLMDIATRKLLSAEHYRAGFSYESHFADPIDERMDLPRSAEEMKLLGTFCADYHVCDRNRHMNNTRYADTLLGFANMEKKWVSHFTIHFANEAKMGERICVYGQSKENTLLFRTVREDGQVNAEAQFTLADL